MTASANPITHPLAGRVMTVGAHAAAYAVAPVVIIENYCLNNHYWTRRGKDPAFPRWLVQTATEIYYATKATPRWKWRARTALGGAAWIGVAIGGCVAMTAAKIIGFPLAVAAILAVAPVAGVVALAEETTARSTRIVRGIRSTAARAARSVGRADAIAVSPPTVAAETPMPTPGPEPIANPATLRPRAARTVGSTPMRVAPPRPTRGDREIS